MTEPWTDDSGAMLVFSADDAAHLERILTDDPDVLSDVASGVSSRGWKPIFANPS